jgi:EAL and modified HD-GYP domain-containing signal transduction protein
VQIVSVPLFNADMGVAAYLVKYNKGSGLLSETQAASLFDGIGQSPVLEALNEAGADAFAMDKPIFVPVNAMLLLTGLEAKCKQPPGRVVFLLEGFPEPGTRMAEAYLSQMDRLALLGFRFAAAGLDGAQKNRELLRRCAYCFVNQESREKADLLIKELRWGFRAVAPVAENIQDAGGMRELGRKGYALFESRFIRLEQASVETNVSPLKMNMIQLMNTVQDDNFEFEEVARVVGSDPALAISLLKLVNARAHGGKIKSIQQAVAMLGQQECRKWVTTAATQSLGEGRPNEITRISLLRAKFAESLAPMYELAHMSAGIFLTGLFSLLDVMLEMPMEQALTLVSVSDIAMNALANKTGLFYPVLEIVEAYERADWVTVSRLTIVNGIDPDALTAAYMEAMVWYKNIVAAVEGGN